MAQAEIGALRVRLGMDAGEFRKGAKDAEGILDRFATRLGLSAGDAEKAAKRIAAGFTLAAAGIAYGIGKTIHEMDRLNEISQQIGIPVERLSELRVAADQSGVSVEDLATSVGRLSRSMVDNAGNAGSDFSRTMAGLGISTRDAGGQMRDALSIFEDVADRFRVMPDGIQKTGIAMTLFGRAGAQMIPMLNEGRAGLAEMREQAHRLGVAFDTETAQAADKLSDTVARLVRSKDALFIKLARDLLPTLQTAASWMEKVVTEGLRWSDVTAAASKGTEQLADKLAKMVGTMATNTMSLWAQDLRSVSTEMNNLAGAIDKTKTAAEQAKEINSFFDRLLNREREFSLERITTQVETLGGAVRRLGAVKAGGGQLDFSTPIDKTAQAAAALRAEMQGLAAAGNLNVTWAASLNRSLQPNIETAQQFAMRVQFLNQVISQSRTVIESVQPPLEALVMKQVEIQRLLTERGITFAQSIDAMRMSTFEFQESQNRLAESLGVTFTLHEQQRQQMERINEAWARGAITADQYGRASSKAAQTTQLAYASAATAVANSLSQVFDKSKAVSVAAAIISTYEAANKALAAPPGPPVSYAYVAAALATGFANVRAILSTSKSSSSTGGGGAGAASAPATPAAAAPGRSLTIQGVDPGAFFGGRQLEALIGAINNEVRNGATLISTRNVAA